MCLATLKLQAAAWVVRSGRCISSSNMEDAGSFYPGQNTRGFWRPGSWFTAWEPSSSLSLFACRRQRAIGRLTWTARLHLSIYQYTYICVERERHWETPRWPSFTSLASFLEEVINYVPLCHIFHTKSGMLDEGSWWAHVFLAYCELSFPCFSWQAGRRAGEGGGALWIEPKN